MGRTTDEKKELIERIKELYPFHTKNEIVEILGISKGSLANIIYRNKITKPKNNETNSKYSKEFLEKVSEFYKTHTAAETAERFGISKATFHVLVCRRIIDPKFSISDTYGLSKEKIAYINEIYKTHTKEETSKITGITKDRLDILVSRKVIEHKGYRRNSKYSEEFINRVNAAYQNYTADETAEKLNIDKKVIHRLISMGLISKKSAKTEIKEIVDPKLTEEISFLKNQNEKLTSLLNKKENKISLLTTEIEMLNEKISILTSFY